MTRSPPELTDRLTRILLVDDHPIVLQGLTQLINQQPDLLICGQAPNAIGAMRAIEQHNPDLAIVDIFLKESNGLELIKTIKLRFPKLLILVLSMHDESLYAERVLRAGARGYIMKEEATGMLINAIRRVIQGEIYLSDKIASRLLSKFVGGRRDKPTSPVDSLSDRELEVFQLIGRGYGTRQIADELHLSVKTVETYRERIKDKLQLDNANELVQHAINWFQGTSRDSK